MSNQDSSGVRPQENNSNHSVPNYNIKVIKQFSIMTIVWGIVGMLVGVIIAAQLVWPDLNVGPYFHFGRLRPLHTNAVIFAFGGSALFAASYHVVQRTCQAPLISNSLAAFTFWGWQLIIVLAAITLPLGLTSAKEYAELQWPIDILIAIVWVVYAIVFFGTIVKRKTKHIYVANWFFGAFIIAVAVLHIVNSLAVPVSLFKSYSIYPGAIDAMVQWWYGHNAVGFFLTAGFLGIMYYFVPKQAERPVYSYRLSIVHFWALIAIYIWAGPHHLHYSALPDWAQSLGMAMSILLLAPSWGGMMAHWMSKTYNANSFPIKGMVLVGYANMPIFICGLMALYPIWWLDVLVATLACCYSIRLLYMGVPKLMKIPDDLGMLYASALFAVALIYMVVVLVATVILWEYVAAPVFVDG
jgi:cytochrome c oxidase cbb3-type subunit I